MKVVNKTYKLEERRNNVLTLFNDGFNIIEISEKLGVSISTISRDLKVLNIIPKGRIDYTSNTIDIDIQLKICELYKIGCSYTDIKKQLNINTTAIKNALLRHNIDIRTIKEATSLKWKDDEFRKNQIEKRKGKPSGSIGKSWKLNYIRKLPNRNGENNHFWKGGKTKLSFKIRNSVEYSFWRKQIFKRDDYTCILCNRKSKKGDKVIIEADHIYPFYKIIDTFNIKTIEEAMNCQEMWDINNGRTLCRECHKKTESYGSNQYS